jgi:hypothetical protein
MSKEPQYARRQCQQLLFLYRIGRGVTPEEWTSYENASKRYIGLPQLKTCYKSSSKKPKNFRDWMSFHRTHLTAAETPHILFTDK